MMFPIEIKKSDNEITFIYVEGNETFESVMQKVAVEAGIEKHDQVFRVSSGTKEKTENLLAMLTETESENEEYVNYFPIPTDKIIQWGGGKRKMDDTKEDKLEEAMNNLKTYNFTVDNETHAAPVITLMKSDFLALTNEAMHRPETTFSNRIAGMNEVELKALLKAGPSSSSNDVATRLKNIAKTLFKDRYKQIKDCQKQLEKGQTVLISACEIAVCAQLADNGYNVSWEGMIEVITARKAIATSRPSTLGGRSGGGGDDDDDDEDEDMGGGGKDEDEELIPASTVASGKNRVGRPKGSTKKSNTIT